MNIVSLKSFLKISMFGSQQDSDPLETICVNSVEDIYDADDLKAYEASFGDKSTKYKSILKLVSKLNSDQQHSWTDTILQLPSINLLDKYDSERFKFSEKKFISVINRNELISQYYEIMLTQIESIYIYGTRGIGKSFLVYQLAARLFAEQDKYRVIYINQASSTIISEILEILAITLTFDRECLLFEDENEEKEILSILLDNIRRVRVGIDQLETSDTIKSANYKLDRIFQLYMTKQIKLIFIIDQTNEMLELEAEMRFLAKDLPNFGFVLMSSGGGSASTTNEAENVAVNFGEAKLEPPFSFTNDEFNSFRHLNQAYRTLVTTTSERDEVMALTGGLAIELSRFFNIKSDGRDFKKRLDAYKVSFNLEYTESSLEQYLNRFVDKSTSAAANPSIIEWTRSQLNASRLKRAYDCYIKMIFEMPLRRSEAPDCYDKRVLALKLEDGLLYVRPINELAKCMLIKVYEPLTTRENLKLDFVRLYKLAFNDSRAKENLLKNFIALSFMSNYYSTSSMKIYNNKQQDSIGSIRFDNFNAERFTGIGAATDFKNPRNNHLLVPLNERYPIYDFFYFYAAEASNMSAAILFCFRIVANSMQDPIKQIKNQEHTKLDVLRKWKEALPTGTEFCEIWILNNENKNSCQGETNQQLVDELNIAYIQDMECFRGLDIDFN